MPVVIKKVVAKTAAPIAKPPAEAKGQTQAPGPKGLTRVKREDFLAKLEMVSPGLSPRGIVQQSNCFTFQNGLVRTFNEEIACTAESGLPKAFTGAVQANKLIDMLRKVQHDELDVEVGGKRFTAKATGERFWVVMEDEVMLPMESVETPGAWVTLPDDFSDAVSIVQACAGKDESNFIFTCVHVHPKFLEACDNMQLTRYALTVPVKTPVVARRDSLKYVPQFDLTEMSVTDKWLHFRNSSGLVLSCRKFVDEYPDMAAILDVKGSPVVLPKSLDDAAEKAGLFSSDNADNDLVKIELFDGKLRITGEGASGGYTGGKKVNYAGPPLSFLISPALLKELVKRHTDCEVSKEPPRLKVDGGKWKYVACLTADTSKGDSP